MWRKQRVGGQTTLEYAVLVAVVVAAAIGVQNYLRRGIHGRVRESTDRIGSQWDAGASTYTANTTITSTSTDTLTNQGKSTSAPSTTQNVTRTEQVLSNVTSSLP